MSLLIKRCYAQEIWAGDKIFEVRRLESLSKKIQENQPLVFHWCSDERLCCKVLRKIEFENVEAMLVSLGPETVVPGRTHEEAAVAWHLASSPACCAYLLKSLGLLG